MKKWMKGLSYAAIAIVLSACGQKSGTEFVGSWQAKEQSSHQAVVERNGDNFLIKITKPSVFPRGKIETQVVPAVYKDGMLEVAGNSGTSRLSYAKDTDTLVVPTMNGSMEYRRVK